ncbi:MAG: prolipoprotein diacylglyceryl transferase [Desulfocapsaceae bacterium]|nr:prolipoprotein diacylglyceryl transferase [Desulfocapsaceae bacterium]
MNDLVFLSGMTVFIGLLLAWGCIHLPGERWQMLATIPLMKREDGLWQGVNLTYYGFFIATSQLLAICLLLILLGAIGLSLLGTLLATAIVLAICIPAARLVAILVEKKRHTFTIGGASFVGILIAPWSIILAERMANLFFPCRLPTLPALAAMAIAYTLGEGLGRLGCISFGCCYGKALRDCSPFLQRLFSKTAFSFHGTTKKAVYEGKLEGEPLIPIQAITSIIYCLTATIASFLFLRSHFMAALIFSITVSQLWRILSETWRADFRGFTKISVYQKMGGLAVLYIIVIAQCTPAPQLAAPAVGQGLGLLWNPGLLIGLQLLWLFFFIFFGRSTITRSTLSFQLIREVL